MTALDEANGGFVVAAAPTYCREGSASRCQRRVSVMPAG